MKVHYPKLYNMVHLLSLNVFTASKGSNNYILIKVLPLHFVAIILLANDKSYDKANGVGLNYTYTEKFVLL